jgi:lipopolysaccharide transport system permease protein
MTSSDTVTSEKTESEIVQPLHEPAPPGVTIPPLPREEPPAKGLPPGRSVRESIAELASSRQILANFVRRDFAAQHRNSFLGFIWSLLHPLLLVAVFTGVFRLLRSSPQGAHGAPFAVFFFSGLVVWRLFSESIQNATASIVTSRNLIQKVYFPREILPLSQVLSGGITFAFEFVVLLLATAVFYKPPGAKVVFAVVPVLLAMMLAYGIGLVLATANVYFRDVEHFISIVLLAWFWFSAVVFDLSWVAQRGRIIYRIFTLNPMVGIVDSFRRILLDNTWPDWSLLGYSALAAFACLVVGTLLFNRFERAFAELV